MNTHTVPPIPKVLAHKTHLFGRINDDAFDLVGGGSGRPYDGTLNTHLTSVIGPVAFPMHILSPIAIMGYPTYSCYQKGASDLFKISNGYTYSRNLEFDCGGRMETKHTIVRTEDGLSGEFEVLQSSFSAPKIVDIEPCVETFIPSGPGRIKSFFTVRWGVEGGGTYSAKVNSEYRLNHSLELPSTHFRFVTFKTDHSATELRQDETLVVLANCEFLAAA